MTDTSSTSSTACWYREREVVWLLLLVLGAYFVRVNALPIFGEEPRRGLIAREMMETGDWIVPRTQGLLRPSRPPLQNWMIAAATLITGSFDTWAVRLPSLLCTLATVLLIYAYSRNILSRFGSLAAATAFATMFQVLEYGRLGETEAVFTLFVAGSLLLWHWGWSRGWPVWCTWSVGYGCAALGLLTKGVQAPIYFVGGIGLYLLFTRQFRALFTRGHIAGIIVGLTIFGAWQGTFLWMMGFEDTWNLYFWNVACRFTNREPLHAVLHFVRYPWEVLGAALFPWSVMLLPFVSYRFRETLGAHRDTAVFLGTSIGWAFIFVWLPPDSRTRYFMPLYPCLAVLIGLSAERLVAPLSTAAPVRLWTNFLRAAAVAMVLAAVALPLVAMIAPSSRLALPAVEVIAFAGVSLALSALAWWSSHAGPASPRLTWGLMSVAVFLSCTAVGPAMTIQSRRCVDIGESVAALRRELPPDVKLVSLNPTQHAFVFHYGKPIPVVTWPTPDTPLPDEVDYFCVQVYRDDMFAPTFAWDEIATIECDRFRRAVSEDRVIIGRRRERGNPPLTASRTRDEAASVAQ